MVEEKELENNEELENDLFEEDEEFGEESLVP